MKETDTRLKYALRSLFRPLANVLLKNRIGIKPIIGQLKLSFVEAARANHGKSGKPATVNMIAQLTGMSRRHVSELLSEIDNNPLPEKLATPVESRVLSLWHSNDEYLDNLGLPRPLLSGPGPGTFRSLVEEVAGLENADDTMRSLLDSEAIEKRADGTIVMTNRVFSINDDLPRIIAVILSPVCSTLDRNWGADLDQKFPSRVAHTTRIDPQKIATVRRISRERIGRFVEEIDDVLCSYETDGKESVADSDVKKSRRVGVGVHYFEVDA
jgi:hypothetical protein